MSFRYVLGHEAMRRMQNSNVLIVGMKGLGLEIAKNVILAGVKSVTIWDCGLAELSDLSAQYYLKEEDCGKRRDECSLAQLAELNTYVPIRILDTQAKRVSELDCERELKDFQVFVLTEGSLAGQLHLNEYSHAKGKAFIMADTVGLFASVFCDFGEEFVTMDATGEQAVSGMISAITQEVESVVTCLEDQRHGLEDGDMVRFKEIKGMTELNGPEHVHKVKVLSPFTFSIGDTSNFSAYETGGVFEQVKQPRKFNFKSLNESIKAPEFVISDFAKMERMSQILAAFVTLCKDRNDPNFVPGRPRNIEDATSFVSRVKNLVSGEELFDLEIDESLMIEFGKQMRGYLAPMCAVIGGMVAQEVLKASSGKFGPIIQHFVFDSLESLPVDLSPVESDFAPQGTRYDAQIAVFGSSFQKRIEESQGFLVGSGAIGCEMVKLYALMGVASGNDKGLLTLTDMDNIEKSNLNRQFLFRPADVGKPKSLTAAEAAFRINPNVKMEARVDRVGAETEHIFNTTFFEGLDFVTNALDNVDARRYMDQRCVFYRRPLLESGTLGTKGNTQVVIPHLTESYSSSQDPPEKTIPFCTLHNFPNTNEHTIQWAMDLFSGTFKADPETVNRFLQHQSQNQESYQGIPPEFESTKDRLEAIAKNLIVPGSFMDCVTWSCLKFQELFSSNIKQLLFNFPKDSITSNGTPFWSGPKRAPSPIEFDSENVMHVDFVWAAAHLRAFIYGTSSEGFTKDSVKKFSETVEFPVFVPKSGVKIAANDSEAAAAATSPTVSNEDELKELTEKIQMIYTSSNPKVSGINVHDFEKDDDRNHHIDFITACANLRAINYEITPTDRHNVKGIAGKIIPAIATTTALVSGLVALELYKVLDGPRVHYDQIEEIGGVDIEAPEFSRYWNLDRFKNGFVNLALPFFAFSSPLPAQKFTFNSGQSHFTLWDSFRIHLSQIPDLKTLVEKIKSDYGLDVTMISSGPSLIYSSYMAKTTTPERMNMPLDQLISFVSKRPIGSHVDVLTLEALCENESGEDAEFPYITLYLKK